MNEVQTRAEELRARRVPFVLATVVRAERPTSAKPGDSAIVLADGTMVGFVGGECAEASVKAQALSVLADAHPVLLRISPEPSQVAPEPGTLVVQNPCLSGGTLDVFLEPELPTPLVVVHGDAPIARAVVALARSLGYEVIAALAPASDEATSDQAASIADAAAVIVSSHGRDEAGVLTAAVRAGVPYVALVASHRRGAAVLAALELSDDERAQIHSPAGLAIGARTPEEVALSILAEMVSVRPRPSSRPEGACLEVSPVAATDPVCGMAVAAVDASLHFDHEGKRYWFCGSGCRQAFVAGPDGFVKGG